MKNRWINLLFALLVILIAGLSYHLFVLAQTKEAVGLIINILKPLNILLFSILLFVLSRHLLKLYLGYRQGIAGFRLQTRLILALLPLTLLPSFALFFLATNFVDEFLQTTVQNPEQTQILEVTDDFTKQHFLDIGQLYTPHGAPLLVSMRIGDEGKTQAYLDRYGIHGVRYYKDGQLNSEIMGTLYQDMYSFSLGQRSELRSSDDGYDHYKDGTLVARYPYEIDTESIELIYVMDTGFTERYAFLRDSYVYLKYGQKKARKLLGLNRGILLVTTLFIIFGGIWVALRFAQRFLDGFKVLIGGAESISKGDLTTRVSLETGDEMEDVATAFNSMAVTLEENKDELEHRARNLGLLNARLESEIHYNQALLKQTRAGILSTDVEGKIQTYNPAFAEILGLTGVECGKDLEKFLYAPGLEPLLGAWNEYQEKGSCSRQLEMVDTDGNTLFFAANLVPLEVEEKRFGDLLVVEDLTELLAAQKLAAWRDVAKRVAHEIKNPLTPIQLSIQRVERKARKGAPDLVDAVFSAHETIISETTLLKNLVNEFSTFAKMPSPVRAETDVAELIRSVCNAYRPVYNDFELVEKIESGSWVLSVDSGQMRQVLGNLLNNAAQASEKGSTLTVGLQAERGNLLIFVDDEGRGIPEAERDKIFMPYYSRSPKGTGLGLAIVKRIVTDHNGEVIALGREPKGTRLAIRLPLGLEATD